MISKEKFTRFESEIEVLKQDSSKTQKLNSEKIATLDK